ncbi:hypothetical protein IV203_012567 [Nitzschia inconspicua]|uniref:Uncharacterized protein n=1 Tax=Nitzschia inconspicua TaxID=303405 RepID=A0A9K3KU45_9STRA|nr:hypothetical protein IV203_012567 [Nitzschia inconspicua]
MQISYLLLTLAMGTAFGLIHTTLATDYIRSRALRPVQLKPSSPQKPKPKKQTKSKKSTKSNKPKKAKRPETDPPTVPPTVPPPIASSPAEAAIRQIMARMPNSVQLLDAVDNGLIPRSMFSAMDDASPCGTVPGEASIISDLSVPQNSNLLTIEGIFSPSDGSTATDIEVTLFGINGLEGSSSLQEDGSFQIILTDPLPGVVPYFFLFKPKDCTKEPIRQEPQVASSGIAMLYVENSNIVSAGQLTITLTWSDDYSDVDLHVIEPGGKKVYFASKCGESCAEDCYFVSPDLAASCAYLELDETSGRGPEHYYARNPNAGKYKVYVNMYSRNGEYTPVTWTLSAKVGAKTVWTKTGTFDNPRDLDNDDSFAYEKMFGPFELDVATVENETVVPIVLNSIHPS